MAAALFAVGLIPWPASRTEGSVLTIARSLINLGLQPFELGDGATVRIESRPRPGSARRWDSELAFSIHGMRGAFTASDGRPLRFRFSTRLMVIQPVLFVAALFTLAPLMGWRRWAGLLLALLGTLGISVLWTLGYASYALSLIPGLVFRPDEPQRAFMLALYQGLVASSVARYLQLALWSGLVFMAVRSLTARPAAEGHG